MKREDFTYIEDDNLPVLILGIQIHEYAFKESQDFFKYNFKPGIESKLIAHQTAGHACHQHYFQAIILTPTLEFKNFMIELDKKYLDSDLGIFGCSLNEILEYKQKLSTIGLDCNVSFSSLEEGIYPIDTQREFFDIITTDKIIDPLDDMIIWKDKWQEFCGFINRWGIWILGKNCD